MKNMIIKHCNRTDYLDRLQNPSSLEILEMLDKHCYLYLCNQTMEETEATSSLTLLWAYVSEKEKKLKRNNISVLELIFCFGKQLFSLIYF